MNQATHSPQPAGDPEPNGLVAPQHLVQGHDISKCALQSPVGPREPHTCCAGQRGQQTCSCCDLGKQNDGWAVGDAMRGNDPPLARKETSVSPVWPPSAKPPKVPAFAGQGQGHETPELPGPPGSQSYRRDLRSSAGGRAPITLWDLGEHTPVREWVSWSSSGKALPCMSAHGLGQQPKHTDRECAHVRTVL